MLRLRVSCSWLVMALFGCAADDADWLDCEGPGASASCLEPTRSPAYYAEMSSLYFDTMDKRVALDGWPPYGETVARWEWPPWLKLTAYTRDNIETTDALLRFYPSIVEERDCRAFDSQPFGRCTVVFYYDAHEGRGCPIYEEFTFNDEGEITWIEAWSSAPGMLPGRVDEPDWPSDDALNRLSTRVPGLGAAQGRLALDSPEMEAAADSDPDVADFVVRAKDWSATWTAELEAAGDDMWARGCGW